MRILFLTQILPFPLDAGPRIKTWNVLQHLKECRHKVTLASFIRPEEEEYVSVLQEICEEVLTVPIRRSRIADVGYWLQSHFSRRPFLVERDGLDLMRILIRSKIREGGYDIVHADQLTMTQFALTTNCDSTLPFRVFDAHNATWKLLERMRDRTSRLLKPILTTEISRIKRYEGAIVREFDHTLAVTNEDRQGLLQVANEGEKLESVNMDRVSVIPIGVDTREVLPVQRVLGSNQILTIGTLHYAPNAEGIRWFLNDVFPLIQVQLPEVRLTIIGKNPPRDFLRLASRSSDAVKVTGYVRDLTPQLEHAAVFVVPVLSGSGMRVRILEAFARGLPVVTTTIGLEGIDATPGEEVILADSPDDFAHAVIAVMTDTGLQHQLSTSGRKLAEEQYDWRIVLHELNSIYESARK